MSHRRNDRCVVCLSADLDTYLDLGEQPLANSYHHGESPLPQYPLAVAHCRECHHSQLTVSVKPSEMFDHYLYVSDTSKTLDSYFDWLTEHVLSHTAVPDPESPPKALEVACNSGLLLEKFHRRGLPCVGVDPAKNLRPLAKARGLLTLTEYWDMETALKITGKWDHTCVESNSAFPSWGEDGHLFDVVLAIHVLPHVPDPREFLAACAAALTPAGKVWVQTSQCDMFRNGEFDAVYHEHTSYFTALSFGKLAETVGLKVVHASRQPIHSMSFLFGLAVADAHCPEFEAMREEEKRLGMDDPFFYEVFASRAYSLAGNLADEIDRQRASGKRVVGYGAAAKGNTVLNHIGRRLDYIVDDNELKWGHLTPGTDIPIESPDRLKDEDDVAVIPLAWNFYDEIAQRAAGLIRRPAEFIRYFPGLSVETVNPKA